MKNLPKSPEMMSAGDTALLVVDVQEKLMPAMNDGPRIAWNVRRLLDAAKAVGIPAFGTEQYPQGLGPTLPEIAERLGPASSEITPEIMPGITPKMSFSCGGCPAIFEEIRRRGIFKILVVGVETHVCVAQTAFDLMADGFRVYVPVDAVGSRFELDHRTALGRLDSAGATLTTTEAAMFEWCESAESSAFKTIRRLALEKMG
jgi:nicotinamidase-related amidase